MRKLLFLSAMLMAGVMACSSCTKKTQTGSSTPPVDTAATCNEAGCPIKIPEAGAVVINDVIQEDNWQFTLSGSGWRVAKSPDDTIRAIFSNVENGTVIFFAKDPTKQTSSEYIINALRSFKAAGTTIQSAKQMPINGTNFIKVTAQGESRKIWTWITVQKNFGYIFTCANDNVDTGDNDEQRCQDIANSIQIK